MAEGLRKTYKEKLRPTPAQKQELELVLWRCRTLYNAALEQRSTAWQRCHVSVSRYEQEAELKAIRADFPEYAAVHSYILQDVRARLDKTYQAFVRRVTAGEKAGFPRFKGRNRWHSCTFKEYGNGARLDNGVLVLSQIGRIAVHWSRPIKGTPKTVTLIDTPHGLRQGILGERMWQPTTLAPEGPARPCKALTASPGACDLMRNPTQAQRTPSKIR
jgi:putative transposase